MEKLKFISFDTGYNQVASMYELSNREEIIQHIKKHYIVLSETSYNIVYIKDYESVVRYTVLK